MVTVTAESFSELMDIVRILERSEINNLQNIKETEGSYTIEVILKDIK